MKKISYFVAVIIATSMMVGCSGNGASTQEEQQTEVVESPKDSPSEEHDHHNEAIEGIVLKNGEKWQVNAEMKPFLKEGASLVTRFLEKPAKEIKDYTTLAANLKAQNDQLIQSCTMKGESHDELHKWLHPHLELVKALSEATDIEAAKEDVEKIKKSYSDFNIYFQ